MKPGVSLHSTVAFFMALPHSTMAENVSSEVSGIRTTSSSFITGTGLKKCSPPNRSGRLEVEAISEMGSEEVLEAKIVLEAVQ